MNVIYKPVSKRSGNFGFNYLVAEKTYLQTILQLGNDWTLRNEGEQLALNRVGERYDESEEYSHLKHQEEEHL